MRMVLNGVLNNFQENAKGVMVFKSGVGVGKLRGGVVNFFLL